MKTIYYFIMVAIAITIASCTTKKSNTNFTDTTIAGTYTIKIPSHLEKFKDGIWCSPKNSHEFYTIEIIVAAKTIMPLDSTIQYYISIDKSSTFSESTLENKDTIKFDSFEGKIYYYTKSETIKSGQSVSTNSAIAVIEDDENSFIIKISRIDEDVNEDILTIIKSLKNNQDTVVDSTKNKNTNNIDKKNVEDKSKIIADAKKNGFQVFEKDGFMVKLDYKFTINNDYLNLIKSKGFNNPTSAYMANNEGTEETGVLYYIVISDMSSDYKNVPNREVANFNKEIITQMKNELKTAGTSYYETTFCNEPAIEYSILHNGLTTKFLNFRKRRKSFTLEITTKTHIESTFKNFKSSFQLID